MLTAYARTKDHFYNAAFLVAVHRRNDIVDVLTESQKPSDVALGAAAVAMDACGHYLQTERNKNKIRVKHLGPNGNPIKSVAKSRTVARLYNGGAIPPLKKLLASQDTRTLYFAIQAAAFAKDASVSEIVSAIEPETGKIAGARLFYLAQIGKNLSERKGN